MNREDIIRMAREAGLPVSDKFDGIGYVWCSDEYPIDEQLQRFAELIAAAEREACQHRIDTLHDMYTLVSQQRDELMGQQRQLIDADALASNPAGLKTMNREAEQNGEEL